MVDGSARGEDVYMATRGDLCLAIREDLEVATREDFFMATDSGTGDPSELTCEPRGSTSGALSLLPRSVVLVAPTSRRARQVSFWT